MSFKFFAVFKILNSFQKEGRKRNIKKKLCVIIYIEKGMKNQWKLLFLLMKVQSNHENFYSVKWRKNIKEEEKS